MDELAYARYYEGERKARELYLAIRDLYGWDYTWSQAYFKAIKDKLLSREEKELVKKYYPIKF